MIVEDGCCKRCKGCIYKGVSHPSHTEWSDIGDPCKILRCEAGVITVSNLRCHTPCANPLPPQPGKCCPTCPECKINGQTASDDRDVVSDDPCLKCRCSKGRMTCAKKSCPVLQCRPSMQHHPPGECCPRCKGTRALIGSPNVCTLQNTLSREGQEIKIDKCTECVCLNNTSICSRAACPILECSSDLQKSLPGSCCPICTKPIIEEVTSQCYYGGNYYEDGKVWPLENPCSSCKCNRGQISCAKTRCNTTCTSGMKEIHVPGECCSKCVEVEGVCMVFGDPHYKSFDGKIYTFQGIGKYQLVKDCHNGSFAIKVANYVTKRYLSSPITRRVAVTFGDLRLNLQQKGRVKYNGQIISIPYKKEGKFRVKKIGNNIDITLQNGVKLLWNGYSFLEVTVPAIFRNKLCGLCGNFNLNVQDDLRMKSGKVVTDREILNFGSSWCVGKKNECAKKNKLLNNNTCVKNRSDNVACKFLMSRHFLACESKLSYLKYYKACKMDMCHCPSGRCYCESLTAYARECERFDVRLGNWQEFSGCDFGLLRRSSKHHRKFQKSDPEDNLLEYNPTNNTRKQHNHKVQNHRLPADLLRYKPEHISRSKSIAKSRSPIPLQ
ncbi:kielin/chordin-like protein isoform X2 [Cylas formicarius]|nr:kielin/chordin-like protein isoform X2 [Cylas formicarius]